MMRTRSAGQGSTGRSELRNRDAAALDGRGSDGVLRLVARIGLCGDREAAPCDSPGTRLEALLVHLGRVIEIWRYPVKSMGGEELERCALGKLGVPGDRGWAVRDEAAGEIRGAKKLPALLQLAARYLEEPAA